MSGAGIAELAQKDRNVLRSGEGGQGLDLLRGKSGDVQGAPFQERAVPLQPAGLGDPGAGELEGARVLAHPFNYEVGKGAAVGSVVHVREGFELDGGSRDSEEPEPSKRRENQGRLHPLGPPLQGMNRSRRTPNVGGISATSVDSVPCDGILVKARGVGCNPLIQLS